MSVQSVRTTLAEALEMNRADAKEATGKDYEELTKHCCAMQSMLDGDVDTEKALLRDYINATVGFEELGKATGNHPRA
jgi:hypothetical protein